MSSGLIGRVTFGRDELTHGLMLCLDDIQRERLVIATPKTARYCDWLVFSAWWWEHTYLIADFLRRSGIKKSDEHRPRIVIGGFNTFNPVPLLGMADFVVVGDGEGALARLLAGEKSSNVLVDGDTSVEWGHAEALRPFCLNLPKTGTSRIEIARGCKFRCAFCAVAHLKPYRELPVEGFVEALRHATEKRIVAFSPEPTLHKKNNLITAICERVGRKRFDTDVRLDRLDLRTSAVPRVGIEGMSERLRRSIKKPYTDDYIVERVEQAIASGHHGLHAYFILDLPGESQEDADALRALLHRLGKLKGASDFTLIPSPSVFMPNPHTPMQYEAIHWDRPYKRVWTDIFGRGSGKRQFEMSVAERTRVFSPGMRLLSMVSTRAGAEFSAVEEELTSRHAISVVGGSLRCIDVDATVSVLDGHGGVSSYCGERQADDVPWSIVRTKMPLGRYERPSGGRDETSEFGAPGSMDSVSVEGVDGTINGGAC